MLHKVDDWLIENVFQKISDRLAGLCSCYAIAAFLLTGAILLNALLCVQKGYWPELAVNSAWLPFRAWDAYRLEQRPRSDILPTERIVWFWQRIVFLTIQVSFTPFFVVCLVAQEYWPVGFDICWWAITVAFYFMACRARPPRRRQARARWLGMLPQST